jgi:hypothetical protein
MILPSGLVELNVIELGTRRNRANVEPLYQWRRDASKLQCSVGIEVVSASVNKKRELIRGGVDNRYECKPAGPIAKRS